MAVISTAELQAIQHTSFLIVPAITAFALVLISRPTPREATAAMVGFLWQLPALLLLNMAAAAFGWWHFNAAADQVAGLPISVWIGWAIWWGPVAVLLNRWLPIWLLIAASVALDMISMPRLEPMVTLGANWLIGDAAAMACLTTGLYVARLTREDKKPKRRAMFHVLGWGGYMLLVLPVCTLSYLGRPVTDVYRWPASLPDWLLVVLGALLLFVGIAATAEFAREGRGTPIPYDPPKSVVVTGPYSFVGNPMQIISAAFMTILAAYAGSFGLLFIAAMFLIFDGLYAAEYNREHIAKSLSEPWAAYRAFIEDWRIRWMPHVDGDAEVIISADGPAHRTWQRLWPSISQHLAGTIEVKTAEKGAPHRLVYRRPNAGIEDAGTRAAGRILEHGPLPVAVIGWAVRFPYIGGAIQRFSGLLILVYRRRFAKQPPGN